MRKSVSVPICCGNTTEGLTYCVWTESRDLLYGRTEVDEPNSRCLIPNLYAKKAPYRLAVRANRLVIFLTGAPSKDKAETCETERHGESDGRTPVTEALGSPQARDFLGSPVRWPSGSRTSPWVSLDRDYPHGSLGF